MSRPLPKLGTRGGGWVAVQVVLLVALFLSALLGRGWPGWLEPFAVGVGVALLGAGAGLLLAGGGALALVRALTPFPEPRTDGRLQTSGAYRLVRHPMYGGGILIGLGWSTVFASVTGVMLSIALALFADLKAEREELWLEQRFAGYAAYRQEVRRRLIPFVW